eukprot:755086-Hanusia_phi.AAC.2
MHQQARRKLLEGSELNPSPAVVPLRLDAAIELGEEEGRYSPSSQVPHRLVALPHEAALLQIVSSQEEGGDSEDEQGQEGEADKHPEEREDDGGAEVAGQVWRSKEGDAPEREVQKAHEPEGRLLGAQR